MAPITSLRSCRSPPRCWRRPATREQRCPPAESPTPTSTTPNADVQGYYTAITDLLNATASDAFVPSLDQLDLLIQSVQIAP